MSIEQNTPEPAAKMDGIGSINDRAAAGLSFLLSAYEDNDLLTDSDESRIKALIAELKAPASTAAQGEAAAWSREEKSRAFEWLRSVATADDAPAEAGIALDTWHALATTPSAERIVADERAVTDEIVQRAVQAFATSLLQQLEAGSRAHHKDMRSALLAVWPYQPAPSPGERP